MTDKARIVIEHTRSGSLGDDCLINGQGSSRDITGHRPDHHLLLQVPKPEKQMHRKSVKISKDVDVVDVDDINIKFGIPRVASEAKGLNELHLYT